MISRRLFLGTSLSGALPLALDVHAFAQAPAVRADSDYVFDHIERELAAALKQSWTAGTLRGEPLRDVASNLRLLCAHGATRGVWTSADRQLANHIGQVGLPATAIEPLPDDALRRLRTRLTEAGVMLTPEELARALSRGDVSARERALGGLHAKGISRQVAHVADALADLARRVDAGANGPVILVRAGAQMNADACRDLWWNMLIMEAAIIAMAATGAGLIAAAQLALALLFLQSYYNLLGC